MALKFPLDLLCGGYLFSGDKLATPVHGFDDWVVLMAEKFMRNMGDHC